MKINNWIRIRWILLSLVFGPIGVTPVARADFTLHFWENRAAPVGRTVIGFGLSSLSTEANYDYDGVLVAPAGLTRYQRVQGDADIAFRIAPQVTLYGTLSWAYITVDGTIRAGNVFGLTDQRVGANWALMTAETEESPFRQAYLQAQIDFPAYNKTNSASNGTPDLGDQSMDLTVGAFAEFRLSQGKGGKMTGIAGVGYQHRSGGFSSAIPWSLDARYLPRDSGFLGSIGFYGQQSLSTDDRANNNVLVTTSAAGEGSGGSFVTGAINPGFLVFRAKVGYLNVDAWSFSALLNKTVTGHFVPAATTFGILIEKQFGSASPSRSIDPARSANPASLAPSEYGKSNQGFVTYGTEAKVLRVSDRMGLIRVDRGSQDGVEVGQIYDVFSTKPDGSPGEAVARCRVTSVKVSEAALKIEEYFKEVWIDEGFIARRMLK